MNGTIGSLSVSSFDDNIEVMLRSGYHRSWDSCGVNCTIVAEHNVLEADKKDPFIDFGY